MKRLKFLPSVLMLVLCVGVLCMGIYAASPNSNQITGSITINPANASVDIAAWAENFDGSVKSTEITKTDLRAGGEILDFTNEAALTLDFSKANTINEVKPCYIKIQITNKSQKELGAYISTEKMTEEAKKGDIFTTDTMTNSPAVTATSLAFYSHLGISTPENDITDTTTLILEFRANNFIELGGPISFENYYVNIEEYNANITTETVTTEQLTNVGGFVKLSSTISEPSDEVDNISSLSAISLSDSTQQRTTLDNTIGFNGLKIEDLDASIENGLWVVIPNGVTTLKNGTGSSTGVFGKCAALTQVSIPNSVSLIGDYAFISCTGLASTIIPNGVSSIGYGAFGYCSGLTSATISESVTTLGTFAFYSCTSLAIVTIPEGVEKIGDSAFSSCGSLTSVTIPSTVTSIGSQAFTSCPNISFSVNENNTAYSNDGQGGLYNKAKTTIVYCSGVKAFVIPESVTTIGSLSFYECTNLVSVTIPSGVAQIPGDTFSYCTGLVSVSIPSTVTSIGSQAFMECTSLTRLIIQGGVTKIGDRAFKDCTSLASITIHGGEIGGSSFNGCTSLTMLILQEGVTKIGQGAFTGCKGLTSVTIPSTVNSMGLNAFSGCTSLASVIIQEGLTSIGTQAFSGCTILTSITIPKSIATISSNAFSGCTSLTSITIPSSVTTIGTTAFGSSGLTQVNYDGTTSQFLGITGKNYVYSLCQVTCTDGVVNKDGTVTSTAA